MHRARLIASLVTVATITGGLPVARARAERPSKAERDRAARARAAFDDGKKAYNLGDFERAIELWKQGYEDKDDPIFLFNIAQAYRQRRDHQKALFFYRAYLREDPKAKNRDDVNARIAELQELMEAQQRVADNPGMPVAPGTDPLPTHVPPEPPPAQPVPAAATEAPLRDEAPEHPGRGMKIGGLVTGGVGVAAAATGVFFLLRASSLEKDVEDAAASGEPWTQELKGKEADGKTAQMIGFVTLGLGVACALGGTTLYLMGARKDAAARSSAEHASWRILPAFGPRAAALSVSVGW